MNCPDLPLSKWMTLRVWMWRRRRKEGGQGIMKKWTTPRKWCSATLLMTTARVGRAKMARPKTHMVLQGLGNRERLRGIGLIRVCLRRQRRWYHQYKGLNLKVVLRKSPTSTGRRILRSEVAANQLLRDMMVLIIPIRGLVSIPLLREVSTLRHLVVGTPRSPLIPYTHPKRRMDLVVGTTTLLHHHSSSSSSILEGATGTLHTEWADRHHTRGVSLTSERSIRGGTTGGLWGRSGRTRRSPLS
jgi:hypothetical protein